MQAGLTLALRVLLKTTRRANPGRCKTLVMLHHASPEFWSDYDALPAQMRERADKQFALLKVDPQHHSLQFKKVGDRKGREIWSARVSLKYRALAIKLDGDFLWFWIGDHGSYEAMIA